MPKNEAECEDIMLEITAGVGGQEAMIFTQELFEMYNSFASYRGWNSEIADYCPTEMGNVCINLITRYYLKKYTNNNFINSDLC